MNGHTLIAMATIIPAITGTYMLWVLKTVASTRRRVDFYWFSPIMVSLDSGKRAQQSMLRKRQSNGLYGVGRCWSIALAACLMALGANARPAVTPAPAATDHSPVLDEKHLWALGMIETGNNDREVGGAGEISRYQIHPAVWRAYSASRDYINPSVSVQVARAHWNYLATYYKEKTGHQPTDFDMYVLWNTTCGYYAHKGFNQHRIASVCQDRAQRFVNLVHRGNS